MNTFIKKMAELFTQLNEAEGMGALVEINEIELAYKNHVSELKKLHIANVVKSLPNDEKLKAYIDTLLYYGTCTTEYNEGFEDGVKWLKEQLAK
jgi:hypothetical protein